MRKGFAAAAVLLLATTMSWAASDKEESTERLQKSAEVLQALMSAPDKGVPEEVVDNAKCILVVPHLDDFSAADFDHLPATVPLGEAAARAVGDLLARHAVSPEAFARWSQRRTAGVEAPAVVVDEIRFEGLKRVDPAIARSVLQVRPGEPIDQTRLDRDMSRLFGTGDFEHVSYSLLEEPGRKILSRGNSVELSTLYRDFRGKDPSVEPLLKFRGLK